jgi:sigma-B regulation protein RsbU (phosphoserine phosphatase)
MNGGDGSEVLADLNQLAGEHGFDAITTAAIVSVHTGGSNAGIAYAGHHPVQVLRRGTSSWEPTRFASAPEELANLPLGVEPSTRFIENSIPAESGDRFFLYTDGVIETPNADGSLFGNERLTQVLNAHATASLAELKSAVLAALRDFAGGALSHDDVTLLAIELN